MATATSFATAPSTGEHRAPSESARAPTASIEYRVIWWLMFGSSLFGGVVVRLAIRPIAAAVRELFDRPIPLEVALRRRNATLLGEARAAADAAAPFVFQVS